MCISLWYCCATLLFCGDFMRGLGQFVQWSELNLPTMAEGLPSANLLSRWTLFKLIIFSTFCLLMLLCTTRPWTLCSNILFQDWVFSDVRLFSTFLTVLLLTHWYADTMLMTSVMFKYLCHAYRRANVGEPDLLSAISPLTNILMNPTINSVLSCQSLTITTWCWLCKFPLQVRLFWNSPTFDTKQKISLTLTFGILVLFQSFYLSISQIMCNTTIKTEICIYYAIA